MLFSLLSCFYAPFRARNHIQDGISLFFDQNERLAGVSFFYDKKFIKEIAATIGIFPHELKPNINKDASYEEISSLFSNKFTGKIEKNKIYYKIGKNKNMIFEFKNTLIDSIAISNLESLKYYTEKVVGIRYPIQLEE